MKILFLLGWPLEHGGHMNSAISLGKCLIDLGNDLYISAPSGPKSEDFKKAGFEVDTANGLEKQFPLNLASVPHLIATIARFKIDIVHSMDYQSLYPGFVAANLLAKKFIFTKAGGTVPDYTIPRDTNIIVYSQELYEGMSKRYPHLQHRIALIKARIDTSLFRPLELGDQSSKGESLRILMAMRFESSKLIWLDSALSGVDDLAKSNSNFEFHLAGGGSITDEIRQRANKINLKHRREIVILLGGISSISEMNRFYNHADIVIGHGRGVMEAMACQKPVLVLGRFGRANIVQEDTVDAISQYNFSGRHIDENPAASQKLTQLLSPLLDQPDTRAAHGSFSKDYIEREYSARKGAVETQIIYDLERRNVIFCYSNIIHWVFSYLAKRIRGLYKSKSH